MLVWIDRLTMASRNQEAADRRYRMFFSLIGFRKVRG